MSGRDSGRRNDFRLGERLSKTLVAAEIERVKVLETVPASDEVKLSKRCGLRERSSR